MNVWRELLDEGYPLPAIMQWLAQEQTREPQIIGRNDPCPCGSGKKYKKCCDKSAR
jgi:uncharacterized protein